MTRTLTALERARLDRLLAAASLAGPDGWQAEVIAGDGSDRCFLRIATGKGRVVAVLPSPTLPHALAEARASYRIASHLWQRRVPVPEPLAFDDEHGIVLFEDLGSTLLHDALRRGSVADPAVRGWYRQAVAALAKFQIKGREGFAADYPWETVRYDRQLMVAREAGYFVNACCRDLLGLSVDDPELAAEFEALAGRAAAEPADFLLHRDFQSRNLMITDDRIRIIDFQGARFGPLAYDLASLLIDPYAALPQDFQDELQGLYCDQIDRYIRLDRRAFDEGYYYMALQRNLQMLGAFAFLSQRKGKIFFRQFLRPAARLLASRLAEPPGRAFPSLRILVDRCVSRLEQQ